MHSCQRSTSLLRAGSPLDPRAGQRLHQQQGQLPGKLASGLIRAAKASFKLLDQVGQVTLDAHLRQFAKSKGIDPDTYVQSVIGAPQIPRELEFLWKAFRELSSVRGVTEAGPQAIPYADIAAWAMLYDITFSPWEVDTIRGLDEMALQAFATRLQNARKGV